MLINKRCQALNGKSHFHLNELSFIRLSIIYPFSLISTNVVIQFLQNFNSCKEKIKTVFFEIFQQIICFLRLHIDSNYSKLRVMKTKGANFQKNTFILKWNILKWFNNINIMCIKFLMTFMFEVSLVDSYFPNLSWV